MYCEILCYITWAATGTPSPLAHFMEKPPPPPLCPIIIQVLPSTMFPESSKKFLSDSLQSLSHLSREVYLRTEVDRRTTGNAFILGTPCHLVCSCNVQLHMKYSCQLILIRTHRSKRQPNQTTKLPPLCCCWSLQWKCRKQNHGKAYYVNEFDYYVHTYWRSPALMFKGLLNLSSYVHEPFYRACGEGCGQCKGHLTYLLI